MEQLAEVTVAYVMIKTELGAAADVAARVSALDGVCWAVVVTGPYDVIAGVRITDNVALGDLVVDEIHGLAGVTETLTAVMTAYYIDGEPAIEGPHGPP